MKSCNRIAKARRTSHDQQTYTRVTVQVFRVKFREEYTPPSDTGDDCEDEETKLRKTHVTLYLPAERYREFMSYFPKEPLSTALMSFTSTITDVAVAAAARDHLEASAKATPHPKDKIYNRYMRVYDAALLFHPEHVSPHVKSLKVEFTQS